jgi:hypothetical protein
LAVKNKLSLSLAIFSDHELKKKDLNYIKNNSMFLKRKL